MTNNQPLRPRPSQNEKPAAQPPYQTPPPRRAPAPEQDAQWAPVRLGAAQPAVPPPTRRQPPVPPSQLPSQSTGQPGGKGQGRSRVPFWLGFTSSFLVLTILSLATFLFSAGFSRFDLATLQGNDDGWKPPEIIATPTAQQSVVSADAAVSGGGLFAPGTALRNVTSSRVNIRQSPGHLGKADNDIIAQIQSGESVTILGPSTTTDNLTWWQVSYTTGDGRTVEGWVAQATASGVQILGQ